MGFFSDLKEDLSQAVNELMPEDEAKDAEGEAVLEDAEENDELAELEEILAKVEENKQQGAQMEQYSKEEFNGDFDEDYDEDFESEELEEIAEPENAFEEIVEETSMPEEVPGIYEGEAAAEDSAVSKMDDAVGNEEALSLDSPKDIENPVFSEAAVSEDSAISEEELQGAQNIEEIEEDEVEVEFVEIAPEAAAEAQIDVLTEAEPDTLEEDAAEEMIVNAVQEEKEMKKGTEEMDEFTEGSVYETPSDESAIITEGMTITGNMASKGSIELLGTIHGNIDILGKLTITGTVEGNSTAGEVFAEGAKIQGDLNSAGSIKVGQSSVIVGNITASSAVIAGAVKGDIDVKGPVILDTSAIVMGNIKSKSVQINNGAVIEGMCSQCYAEVNPTSFFEKFN